MILGIKWLANEAYSFTFGSYTFGFKNLSYGHIIYFSIVSSLLVPAVGTLIASIAKNKIEGFAFMKSGGILVMIPALVLIMPLVTGSNIFLAFPLISGLLRHVNQALNSTDQAIALLGLLTCRAAFNAYLAIAWIISFARKQASGE